MGERDKSLEPKIEINSEAKNSAKSLSEEGLDVDTYESLDHTQNY